MMEEMGWDFGGCIEKMCVWEGRGGEKGGGRMTVIMTWKILRKQKLKPFHPLPLFLSLTLCLSVCLSLSVSLSVCLSLSLFHTQSSTHSIPYTITLCPLSQLSCTFSIPLYYNAHYSTTIGSQHFSFHQAPILAGTRRLPAVLNMADSEK